MPIKINKQLINYMDGWGLDKWGIVKRNHTGSSGSADPSVPLGGAARTCSLKSSCSTTLGIACTSDSIVHLRGKKEEGKWSKQHANSFLVGSKRLDRQSILLPDPSVSSTLPTFDALLSDFNRTYPDTYIDQICAYYHLLTFINCKWGEMVPLIA
jgi:hypothetical protein